MQGSGPDLLQTTVNAAALVQRAGKLAQASRSLKLSSHQSMDVRSAEDAYLHTLVCSRGTTHGESALAQMLALA